MSGSDRVKPAGAGLKLTCDDVVLFDGKRHELIDGEHYVTPSPRDETTKRHLYERSGVSEYWVVFRE